MTDQVNEAVAWVVPSARVTPDGSYEDGPDSLVFESDATDYIRRIGSPLYAHPSRGVVDDGVVERAMDADAEEYGASIPASRVRRILEAAALQAAALPAVPAFDMLAHLQRQREWSGRTFGPGPRSVGVIDHIRKELREIEADPTDLSEWIDVVILALDGAWRAGGTPEQIIATLVAKQTKNEGRTWPDWRTASPDKAIEHDRTQDALPAVPEGESVTLTVAQIADLARFAGLTLAQPPQPTADELEAQITVCECPDTGVLLDGEDADPGLVAHYTHTAYYSEYPGEGCIGLGPELVATPKDQPAQGEG